MGRVFKSFALESDTKAFLVGFVLILIIAFPLGALLPTSYELNREYTTENLGPRDDEKSGVLLSGSGSMEDIFYRYIWNDADFTFFNLTVSDNVSVYMRDSYFDPSYYVGTGGSFQGNVTSTIRISVLLNGTSFGTWNISYTYIDFETTHTDTWEFSLGLWYLNVFGILVGGWIGCVVMPYLLQWFFERSEDEEAVE